MNSVQELIDEHMDQMPTALAKKLLDACKAEADAKPKLYRITVTRVNAVTYTEEIGDETEACVKLQDLTETLIVEVIDDATFDRMRCCAIGLLAKGMLYEPWLKMSMPRVINRDTFMLIVHSIVPYVPKRARDEWQ